MKMNQKGFSAVEAILVVVVLGLVGAVGWLVYDRQNNKTSDTQTTTTTSQQESPSEAPTPEAKEDISADWKRYNSGQGGFSIKIADGMNGYNYTSADSIVVRTYSKNKSSADIKELEFGGSDAFSVLSVYQRATSGMWSPDKDDMRGLVEKSFTTDSGIKGTKQTYTDPYEPPCQGPGCYIGTKHIYYTFKHSNGKTTRIVYSQRILNAESKKVYDITESDPDLTEIADAIAKSLKINN